jgi:CBS domain-containing protein
MKPKEMAMNIGHVCNRQVAQIGKSETVLEAARRMRDEHVGDLVVVDHRDGRAVPVGVLTDRDIVVGLLAKDVDHLRQLDVGDVLPNDVVTACESEDVEDVLRVMRRKGIRRIPIVDRNGSLVGIFTVDDLIGLLSDGLSDIVSLMGRQRRHEVVRRP